MVWAVLLKFPLFLREVLCAALPLQLLSEDLLATSMLFKDCLLFHELLFLYLAVGPGGGFRRWSCMKSLLVVPTLLDELCFAVPLLSQEGLMNESLRTRRSSVAGAALGTGAPLEVSARLARGALCNLAAAFAVRGPARRELALQGPTLFRSFSSCTWPRAPGSSYRWWSCGKCSWISSLRGAADGSARAVLRSTFELAGRVLG